MKYLTNNIAGKQYSKIITVIPVGETNLANEDFKTIEGKLIDSLSTIKLKSLADTSILIDTALYNGVQQYRFVKAFLDKTGLLIKDSVGFVDVEYKIQHSANCVFRRNDELLEGSILTIDDKKKILI